MLRRSALLAAALAACLAAFSAPTARAGESRGATLALTWTPAFCETAGRNRGECKLLAKRKISVWSNRFNLHGLWPERGEYCGATKEQIAQDALGPRGWRKMKMQRLPKDLADRLVAAMPGALSGLHKHEWVKHGLCHGDPDGAIGYYQDSLAALEAVNRAGLAKLARAHVGRELRAAQLRAALDRAFGKGAGERLQMVCVKDRDSGRRLISEIRISLRGELEPGVNVGRLILAARPRKRGCRAGIVDPVGAQ